MSMPPVRWQVRGHRPVAYDVVKAPGLFDRDNRALLAFGRRTGARRFVVVDANVAHHHGVVIRGWFTHHGVEACLVALPGGEANKTLALYQDLLRQLDAFPIHRRDDPIIAIGGGVLTDATAFAAATYRRGVPHLKVPTTLMGYVDAALGIKNGINFNGYKNRLGSFEPPLAVLLDRSFLHTLPHRHLLNGVCEIVKLAIIRDAVLFEQLEADGADSIATRFASPVGDAILDRAIGGMLDELAPNLFEDELSRSVDFGHTFSCALETRHDHRLLHGEAVLLDILVSLVIAERRGLLDAREVARVFALVDRLGIAPELGVLDTEVMWQSLLDRIEHRNGRQRLPLPAGIGRGTFIDDLTRRELDAAVTTLHAGSRQTRDEPARQR